MTDYIPLEYSDIATQALKMGDEILLNLSSNPVIAAEQRRQVEELGQLSVASGIGARMFSVSEGVSKGNERGF